MKTSFFFFFFDLGGGGNHTRPTFSHVLQVCSDASRRPRPSSRATEDRDVHDEQRPPSLHSALMPRKISRALQSDTHVIWVRLFCLAFGFCVWEACPAFSENAEAVCCPDLRVQHLTPQSFSVGCPVEKVWTWIKYGWRGSSRTAWTV